MSNLLATGSSALIAFQRALSTVGHNVANINTPGYSRQRVELEARDATYFGYGYQGNGVQIVDVRRMADSLATSRLLDSGGELARLQQLLLAQEVEKALDGAAVELQGGALVDVVDEGLGVVVLPAAQHLEAGPVELEEQVAHGVVQGPAGLAVGQARSGMDGQLLAQQG